jgi:hypothetical protein
MNPTSSLGSNGPLLLLITCYALLAILVLALLLYTRWSYWIKTLTILLTGVVILFTYDTMTALLGFPTPGKLPERFLLHHSVILQPDKNTSSKGMIFLWASELTRDGPAKQPRAYEMPWDKETSNSFTEANRRTKQGIMQMGQVQQVGPKSNINTFTKYMSSSKQQKVKLQDMPEPALPEK